ncbi:NAD-dependent epimerase/dehydratase family protein [Thermosyntropha sp.]|uniref:NAD-dependent epimerase/dehydratase family protein n=1 Tax=Thermosyntropha sp. TaxID=2740820 RepID=UPI0025E43E00|nr:NAD-dependent epimerase/dehydratase family protein [Thermosyntropha sp.]MBO8159922.1 NAD-dependent epimerase/dehydratase family protein [Thermosyntropha sp.]
MKEKTVIVTGGAGVIGSHLVEYLVQRDYEVIVIDNLSAGRLENLPDYGKVFFYRRDVRDESLQNIYYRYKPFLLFHLAAHYANELSIKEPVYDLKVNTVGTLNQLNLAVKAGVKRFVYASTSCVYLPSVNPLEEESPLKPHTPYGISKLAGEYYTFFYAENYGLPVTVLRYFNVYGPKEANLQYRGVIPKIMAAALQDKPFTLTGSGDEARDFTFIKDAVKGTVLAAFSEKGVNQVFNIGTGRASSILEVINMLSELSGEKISIRYDERRKWDKTVYRLADIKKAHLLLGYEPEYELREGLKLTLDWYKDNLEFLN